jgi:Flp pilus assembly pilin Flp
VTSTAPFIGADRRERRVIRISTKLNLRGRTYAARPTMAGAAIQVLGAYGADELGASATEYAVLLFVLCGCVIFGLHSLGRHASREVLRVSRAIGGQPAT